MEQLTDTADSSKSEDSSKSALSNHQKVLASAWQTWKGKKIRSGIACPVPKLQIIRNATAEPLKAVWGSNGKVSISEDLLTNTGNESNETLINYLIIYNGALIANPWLKRQKYLAIATLVLAVFCTLSLMFWAAVGALVMSALLMIISTLSTDYYVVRAINARQAIAGLTAKRRYRSKELSYFDKKRILIMREGY
jgi:hypothetical protein